jgi:hypothetical protein
MPTLAGIGSARMAKKDKSRPLLPCVVSLRGPGIRLRLEIDRPTCVELAAMVATIVHANVAPSPEPSAVAVSASVLPPSPELNHDERHAFNHRFAPDALRELYKTLCDDLLGDAQLALDEEKRRRAGAS